MQLKRTVLRTTVLYAVFAGLWIILSDRVLDRLVPQSQTPLYQTTKGLLFVAVTATLLYLLIRSQMRSVFVSESRMRAVFDSIADGLLIVDMNLRIKEVNDAALLLFGYAPGQKEKLLKTIPDIVREFDIRSPSGSPLDLQDLAAFQAIRGKIIHSADAIVKLPHGKTLELDISAAPIQTHGDGVRGAAIVLRDITEMRRLQKLRDEFLSTAAHEFKTPLAVIKANAQLLQTVASRWPEEKKLFALKMIDRQCQKANRLVHDLLIGSRLENVAVSLRKTRFDIAELARELIESLQPTTPKHTLSLSRPPSSIPTVVNADRPRIEQVLVNLVENAIKYSPEGGEVSLRVYREGPRIWVSVTDPGIGIPAEKQARIFEKFYSAHSGTPYDFGGLGIGLSLSRDAVVRHGGTIEFDSNEMAGSTFRFSLPVAQEAFHERTA